MTNKTIEVKCDRIAVKTGNVYIEYESRGKPSGISTSQADYWVYKFDEESAVIFKTEALKNKLSSLQDSPFNNDIDKYFSCLYFHNKIGFLLSDNIKNTELIFNIIKKILKEKTKMTAKQIDDINSKFSIINANEAKKIGLCDNIIKYRRQNQKTDLQQNESLRPHLHSHPKNLKNSKSSLR
jgi:hypothetical protein